MHLRRPIHVLALVLAAFPIAAAVSPGARAAQALGARDAGELEAFVDGLLAAKRKSHHVPGAVFLWVRDGRVLLAKGYGVEDLETGVPVDPARTAFRVGSISKLFTATAAMQLRERGLLDFHRDVNDYLERFQVPDAPGSGPVTMHHLLTHTAGFDDRNLGTGVVDPADAVPLGDYLARRLPPRVLPLGQTISYSNHGLALAGYVIEAVSGVPFEDFVRKNLFEPLDMERSGWGRVDDPLVHQATSYEYVRGRYRARPGDAFSQIAPAAALTLTATDMAHFMLAHLQEGRYGGARILSPESVREMHAQRFTHHPDLDGWGWGFATTTPNGHRAVGHGGWTDGFCSALELLPEQGEGFFLSVTADCAPGLLDDVVEALFDRYFPPARPEPDPSPSPDFAAERFEGPYWPSRHSRYTAEKAFMLLNEVRVVGGGDGTLTVFFPDGRDPIRAAPVGPLRFDEIGGEKRLAFERVPWYASLRFQAPALAACLLVFVVACLGWPVGAAIQRVGSLGAAAAPPLLVAARATAGLAALAALVFTAWIGAIGVDANLFDFLREPERLFGGVFWAARLAALLALVAAALTVAAWLRRAGDAGARARLSLVVAATLFFAWAALYWNWLTPRL